MVSLNLLGPDNMLPPALAVIVLALLLFRIRLERAEERKKAEEQQSAVQPMGKGGADA